MRLHALHTGGGVYAVMFYKTADDRAAQVLHVTASSPPPYPQPDGLVRRAGSAPPPAIMRDDCADGRH